MKRQTDYKRFLKMVNHEPTDVPLFFEHYVEPGVKSDVLGDDKVEQDEPKWGWAINTMNAHVKLGCDVCQVGISILSDFTYPQPEHEEGESISQNTNAMIYDDASFKNFPFPDPGKADVEFYLNKLEESAPEGLKVFIGAGRGIFESLVDLVGFDNLCMMTFDNPELIKKIVDEVGSRAYRFIEKGINHDFVIGYYTSDDWGYKTALMFSPDFMREYIFPWHKKIVELAHSAGKIAMLHSCGNIDIIMDDIIDDLKYDALTSFEDVIEPVESVYERYGDRIAIVGGLDQDYMHTASPEEIRARAKKLFEMSKDKGGYALGTGNSITDSMPKENWEAIFNWH